MIADHFLVKENQDLNLQIALLNHLLIANLAILVAEKLDLVKNK
jgi:hypothetical protein